MRAAPIVLLLLTAAVVGWMAPGLSTSTSTRDVTASQATEEEAAGEARRQAWLAGGSVLERAGDGHFYLDARVDGQSVHFLVDTGASIVALTAEDGRAAGLDWNEDDVRPIGRGANGTVYGVPMKLARIEVDGLSAEGVEAAILPEGLDVSLLGQSFLAKLPGVAIEGDRMLLGVAD